MGLSTAGANVGLNAVAAQASLASLHNADPGDTGASELSGGTYARKPITWNAAATRNLDSSNEPLFDVPAGGAVRYFGLWTSAGVFLGSGQLVEEIFAQAGQYRLKDADIGIS